MAVNGHKRTDEITRQFVFFASGFSKLCMLTDKDKGEDPYVKLTVQAELEYDEYIRLLWL